MARLMIVSTPIGNRQDISLRALEALSKVDIILCEDTRKTGQLLEGYEKEMGKKFEAKRVSFYEANEEQRTAEAIEWLSWGKDIALVSNAGTPLLSDPGFKLVRECIKQGITVEAVPGASALMTGLVISGLPTDKFMFLGFLPKKPGKKERLIEKVRETISLIPQTVVFYESPFRLVKTLELLERVLPEAEVVIGRELTKKFETVYQGSAKTLLQELRDKKIKGELVVLMNSKKS